MTSLNLLAVLNLIVLLMVSFSSNANEGVSEAKYNDFYRRQLELKKEDAKRETGRLKHIAKRAKSEAKFEKLEAEFAKKSRAKDQDLNDKIAEDWMETQNQKHEKAMEKAREKYLAKRKQSRKFKIPESEEFEVD